MTVAKPPHPFVASHPSTSGLKIALHPLALLTISDYVTRHTLRQGKGVIVGALLGSQNGREISIEHAYELKLLDVRPEEGQMDIEEENVRVDEEWFTTKLKQFKDVHPTLDLVGHFTYLPPPPNNLPRQLHLNIQNQLLQFNESLIFLAMHPSVFTSSKGGKLPLTIWESVYEEEGESKTVKMKFTELDYTIETGEAEMIGVDHVAHGGGNAGDEINGIAAKTEEKKEEKKDTKGKGKAKELADAKEEKEISFESINLPTQTQELLSTLTAKANAVRMLHSRLTLLLSYLRSIESSSTNTNESQNTTTPPEKINHPLLRSLLSLTNRLPLIEPPATTASSLQGESLSELSDVHLIALLGAMTTSIDTTREVGRKFTAMQQNKPNKGQGGGGMGDYAGYDSPGTEGEYGGGYGGKGGGIMGPLTGLLRQAPGGRQLGRRF